MFVSYFYTSSKTTSTLATGYITVSGHYEYWDNNETLRPTVWGRVRIYDVDPTGLRRLTDVNGINEWFTDANGNFSSASILNYDPVDGGGLDIMVYIYTWNQAVAVINGTGSIYNFGIGTWSNCPDGYPVDFSMKGVPSNQIGAWMIFSYRCGIATGWNYLKTQTGYEAPMVTCRWPFETSPHYHPGGEIHLPDWACWWPDTILHEYAHHVMYSFYGYMPPTMGVHYMEKRSNTTTAWAEGWAHFFPLAVYNKPTRIVGINATHGVEYNLEAPHWCSPGWDDGDEVEGRVAGALWDIYDSQNDSAPWYYDSFSNGFTNIWNIMHTTSCDTFHEFWQAWYTSGYPKQPALMAIFQNSIDYRGPGDVNGDCKCTIADLVLTIGGFGTQKGDPDWDKRRDLNNDDKVDVSDLAIVVTYQGRLYDC